MNFIYGKLMWALTDRAKVEIVKLLGQGLDFDLAFILVENRLAEDVFWLDIKEACGEDKRLVRAAS